MAELQWGATSDWGASEWESLEGRVRIERQLGMPGESASCDVEEVEGDEVAIRLCVSGDAEEAPEASSDGMGRHAAFGL